MKGFKMFCGSKLFQIVWMLGGDESKVTPRFGMGWEDTSVPLAKMEKINEDTDRQEKTGNL